MSTGGAVECLARSSVSKSWLTVQLAACSSPNYQQAAASGPTRGNRSDWRSFSTKQAAARGQSFARGAASTVAAAAAAVNATTPPPSSTAAAAAVWGACVPLSTAAAEPVALGRSFTTLSHFSGCALLFVGVGGWVGG